MTHIFLPIHINWQYCEKTKHILFSVGNSMTLTMTLISTARSKTNTSPCLMSATISSSVLKLHTIKARSNDMQCVSARGVGLGWVWGEVWLRAYVRKGVRVRECEKEREKQRERERKRERERERERERVCARLWRCMRSGGFVWGRVYVSALVLEYCTVCLV